MTPTLRKTHRYIWFSLAVLLPAGWLAAIWAIPGEVWQTPLRPEQPAPLALVVQSKESGDFIVNLRQDSIGGRKQIEVFIKKPLLTPNTTLMAEGPEKIIGQLGTRGFWRFELDSLTSQSKPLRLRFEDKIQRRTLRTIEF